MDNNDSQTDYGFVLSDNTTQMQFNAPKVAFNVKEVREYGPALAYVTEEYNDLNYMVVHKTNVPSFHPRVYYLDFGGNIKGVPGLSMLLNENGNDLATAIEVTIKEDGTTREIHWYKKGPSLVLGENHILAEYVTRDKKMRHNLCLIDWKGDNKTGRIEVWYGQKIKRKEVRLFHFPKSDVKIS